MTSICNYSHPELQITTGLVRQTSGALFPYNPEFYKLVSGLYGPGTSYCWYLLLASVVINWSFHAKNDRGYRQPGVSNDLLAALAYPAFAATDAMIHGIQFLGTEYRALAIFCLRNPGVELTGFATFNNTQLDLRDIIPPEVVSLGQRAINITGPLPVCYTFISIVFITTILDSLATGNIPLRPTKWARWLIYGTYGYVILLMTIFHMSLDNVGISIFLSIYEAIIPFLLFALFALCFLVSISTIGAIGMLFASLWDRNKKDFWEALKILFACIFAVIFPAAMLIAVYFNRIPLVPDLAISLSERDQIAALLGGIVTVLFTVGHPYFTT